MDREIMLAVILERVQRLNRAQLLELSRLLDQLQGRPGNPPREPGQDPKVNGSG